MIASRKEQGAACAKSDPEVRAFADSRTGIRPNRVKSWTNTSENLEACGMGSI